MPANRLYRYGIFEPVAAIGEYVQLLPAPASQPYHRVAYVEPVPFLDSFTGPPGILLRDFSVTSLTSGSSFSITPVELQVGQYELLQFRMTLFEMATGAGLVASAQVPIDQIHVQVFQLGANRRWTSTNAGGILLSRVLMPLATAEAASWDSSQAAATLLGLAATANINRLSQPPFPWLNMTELFTYQTDSPSFTVINRSGTAGTTATTISQGQLRLACAGFRYILEPLPADLEGRGTPYTRIPVQGHGFSSQALQR